jgi:hypothetical protein
MKIAIGADCAAMLAAVAACNPEQRDTLDSAAGAIGADVRAELSVLDIDMGKRAGANHEVDEEVDVFAPTDTIYASVNTTGTVRPGAITSQWTFPDGSVIDQQAQPTTAERDANLLFFITRPEGLAKGKYTFKVLVDGREVRSSDVTVR